MTQKERINILNILKRLANETYCGDCMFYDECALKGKCIYNTAYDLIANDDSVPVVHGQWLRALGSMPPEVFGRHACSVCDHFAPNDYHGKHEFLSPICPYCGAKMDGKDGEQDGKD